MMPVCAGATAIRIASVSLVPPGPVQVRKYKVPLLVAFGVIVVDPFVLCAPDHPPDAVHEVAFVEDHVSATDWPSVMELVLTDMNAVGAGIELVGAAVTFTIALPPPPPPGPVQ
jgi:hypothetical protein